MEYFVHESSYVDDGVEIGKETKIWHFSHVQSGAKIGMDCILGQNVNIANDVTIGNNVKIQNNVSVYKGVTLEDDVFCGPSMVFTNVFNPRAHVRRMDAVRKTFVGKGATFGANSTIVCGVTIGQYSMIAAGAVVTKDVRSHALMKGNPARESGWVCSCGVKLDSFLICKSCGARFEKTDSGLREVEREE
ncbi:MAG TPA: N-acetyltransferase [Desulfovibrio sp.]|nr:N-acetyltransferase [Desulfovibrio sp.]